MPATLGPPKWAKRPDGWTVINSAFVSSVQPGSCLARQNLLRVIVWQYTTIGMDGIDPFWRDADLSDTSTRAVEPRHKNWDGVCGRVTSRKQGDNWKANGAMNCRIGLHGHASQCSASGERDST